MIKIITTILILIYLGVFWYDAQTRVGLYHSDFMNYIDVAKHIRNGDGVAQSAFGFNQPRFDPEARVPQPLIEQPPLYPLAIALFIFLGFEPVKAAFLVVTLCFGVMLYLIYRLAAKIYDERTAMLSLVFLLFYQPLKHIAKSGLSELLAFCFLLFGILLMYETLSRRKYYLAIAGGLITGFAFATRYAFISLFFWGIIVLLWEMEGWKAKLRFISCYASGFSLIAILVLGHNLLMTGHLVVVPNPSSEGILTNINDMWKAVLGGYVGFFSPMASPKLWALILLAATLLAGRTKTLVFIKEVAWKDKRYLLTLWIAVYLGYLLIQRSQVFFDTINFRLTSPASIIGLVIWAAYLIIAIKPGLVRVFTFASFGIIAATLAIAMDIVTTPAYSAKKVIENSETMSWIQKNTGKEDLIITNNAVDIPFFLGYPAALSFNYYPYTEPLTEADIDTFVHKNKFRRVFLIYRTTFDQDKAFGPLIDGLRRNPASRYPKIQLIAKLKDGLVFEIIENQNPKPAA